MPPQKSHENPVSHFQKLISKKRTYFLKIFLYSYSGNIHLHLLKNQCCSFTLSMLFCGKTEMRNTFCAGTPYDTAERWLIDDFSQNIFHTTPPKNC